MLGRLLKTLSHLLKTEEAKWRSENPVRRKMSYGRLRGVMVRVAERPLRWLFTVLVILSISSVGLCFMPSDWLFEVPADFNTVDLIVYFSALWSVQGAVAALVYPIVIAFVTLLLQRRHSAKAVLHIYLHDSAAIFSGLSALSLLVLMTLQYLLLTLIRIETGIAWLLLDGMWFFVNLGLTSFFLYRTFKFVQPSRRAEAIRQYAINVTWPRELREHLASDLFLTAVARKFLPGPIYRIGEEKTPSVWLGRLLFNEGVPVVERLLPSDSRLTDVRFRVLAWATSCWLRRANRSGPAKEQESSETLRFRDQHKTPILLYPLEPGSPYSGNTALCRVIGTVDISWLERRLVRWAFKFRRSPLLELTVKDVLDDLKAEAMLALRDDEPEAFSGTIGELVDLYALLIEASAYQNTEGSMDNYACVSDRHRTFRGPAYEMWSQQLVDLFKVAAERVSSDEAVKLAYVPGRLFSRLKGVAQVDMLVHLVELPPVLFHRLGGWWVKTLEQQGIIEHDACNAASLRPPFFGTYDSILRSFVGAWELLKNNQFSLRRDETLSWPDLQDTGRYFESHLQATAAMIIECIHRGDKTGTDWILNVLLRWFSDLQLRLNVRSYFLFRHEVLISFELIKRSWEEAKGTLDVEEGGYIQEPAPKVLFAVMLQNYWIDVCCVIAYMLIMRGKHCPCDQSLPARVLRAMVFGEVPRPDGQEIDSEGPLSNANDLLMAILRQYYVEGGYRRGYRARLDDFVERLAEVTKEARISGRIYSGWGADDLNSLSDGQIVLLAFFVPERWNPGTKVERTIRKWVREDDAKLRELMDDLKQWKERIAQPDFAEYRGLFECVKRGRAGPSFDEAIANVAAGIDELVANIEAIRAEVIQDLTVSQARLEEVGEWASAFGFSKVSGAFPLPLFDSVGASDRKLQSRSLVVPKREKGEYTEPAMAQRPVNEEDWFGKMARNHVAASILMEAIEQLAPQEEDGDSPDVYWEQMKQYADDATRAGRQAILLIENPTIPNWIYEWTHPYRESPEETPPDLEAWRDAKIKSDAYLGSLNKVAVYVAPIPPGASYLLTSESFKSVTFTRLANGNFVFVEALPTEADTALIDLRLTWWFDLDLDIYPAVKLTYGSRGQR